MSEPNQIPVILNPTARSGGAESLGAQLEQLSLAVSLRETASAGDAAELAYEAIKEGASRIVAAGGDGTINQVIYGFVRAFREDPERPLPALGVLPTGTMNVFSRELGIPQGSVEEAWGIITEGQIREVDLWKVGDAHHFVQIAGVGADAEVIGRTSWESKKAFGPLSYVVGAAGVVTGKAAPLQIRCPKEGAFEGTSVLVGSGRLYGGPFVFFPDARNDDGLIDVLVMRGHGPLEVLNLLKAIALTGYRDELDIDYFQSPGFEVIPKAEGDVSPFQIDGELGGVAPVSFALSDLRLPVLCPRG